MSIVDGQRDISWRQRITAYCEQHRIAIPAAFQQAEVVYPLALVDRSVAERPRLVGETFYNVNGVLSWFRDRNRYPPHYQVLDFKRGRELVLENAVNLVDGPGFDPRRDVDLQY
ncbi:hypothetical protein [Eleftheria terrae]|uniref:hypothetical protein n=1 Tax=Eleftheria terrae TaxID=1597781 RepID=UPI00263B5F8A|nr:hypothetical protein [Eleftheria terrae]WKB53161.1 hypothetical protein N7L95_01785 [Eleftheria terrae]